MTLLGYSKQTGLASMCLLGDNSSTKIDHESYSGNDYRPPMVLLSTKKTDTDLFRDNQNCYDSLGHL